MNPEAAIHCTHCSLEEVVSFSGALMCSPKISGRDKDTKSCHKDLNFNYYSYYPELVGGHSMPYKWHSDCRNDPSSFISCRVADKFNSAGFLDQLCFPHMRKLSVICGGCWFGAFWSLPRHRCGKWSALAVGGGFLLISSHGQGHQGEDLGINLDRSGHIGT